MTQWRNPGPFEARCDACGLDTKGMWQLRHTDHRASHDRIALECPFCKAIQREAQTCQ